MLYATIPIGENINANITNLGDYSSNIVGLMLTLAGIAAFVYLAYGGLTWILASGDKAKLEDARGKITNAIIGLGIVASSWAIFLVLNHFFGLGLAGDSSSGGNGGNGSGSSSGTGGSSTLDQYGISVICTTQSQCDAYCPNPDYVTVHHTKSCEGSKVSCACVHKDNPKLNAVPAGNKK